ncbi:MAG: hypothetical protein NZ695_03185 [Dehalococcoidia bacterium]|jgi:hypothetical protein|nr:hypothetical protein [Dehalococcoidia bacterium]MDW8009583.1 hypothetical protein [Chloroflexota bacterium]
MTSRFALNLSAQQLRVVYLAVGYHLARPGSEIDPDTLQEYEHGLRELPPVLEPLLEREEASIVLSPFQLLRLDTALLSIINELKSYPLLDTVAGASGRPRSLAPGFDDLLKRLFPRVAEEPDYTLELAEEALRLHRGLRPHLQRARELVAREREEASRRPRRRRWQFWRRSP